MWQVAAVWGNTTLDLGIQHPYPNCGCLGALTEEIFMYVSSPLVPIDVAHISISSYYYSFMNSF